MAIEIEDYTAPVAANRYDGDVADLIAAGAGKRGKITVPKGEKVTTEKLAFQNAAKAKGFSARVKLEETDEKGNTVLGFVLFDKRKPRESASVEAEAPEVTTKD